MVCCNNETITTHLLKWPKQGTLIILYTGQNVEHLLLMKGQNGASTLKDNLEVPYKIKSILIV